MDAAGRARAAVRLPCLQRYPPRRAVDVARAAGRTAAAAGRVGNRREEDPRGRRGPRILADADGRIRPRDRAPARPLGLAHTRDRITADDLDPALMMWTMRQRTDLAALPDHRVVIRFEFSGVPANRTRLRIMWLVLDRSAVDVCAKDPGFPVDITLRGDVVVFVRIYLGQTTWDEVMRKAIAIEGNERMAQRIPEWIQLRKVPRPQPPSARPAA